MKEFELINRAATLINKASVLAGQGKPSKAQLHLVELRELLNEQHELEAGGSLRPAQGGKEVT